MMRYWFILLMWEYAAYGALAGGRPNAFSEGENSFAGVINPANAVWLEDRIDIGAFYVHQNANLTNYDDNPLFPPGKTDLMYRCKNLFTADAAVHKQVNLKICSNSIDTSFSLAAYTMPSYVKLGTKIPIPSSGTTPVFILYRTDVVSGVFSLKLNRSHSIGFSIDYLYLSHCRNGYQNADTPLRSVSPGHVTNNGTDHSRGVGLSIGWRWKITDDLNFGAAWSKKTHCGQFRKYRGFEPFQAQNYMPQTIGCGLSYRFTSKLSGRVEALWLNLGNLPYANNGILSDGSLNLNKRGSDQSPGPGLNDATFLSIGLGYKLNSMLALGSSYSHRIKLRRQHTNIFSHMYSFVTVYDALALGASFSYQKHDLFLDVIYGFRNKDTGFMSKELGGGQFAGEKRTASLSLSWGYRY